MPPLDSDNGTREPATGATKGNHLSHTGSSAATCVKCHGSELTSTGHRDKRIQVEGNINNSPKTAAYTRAFVNQTSVPPVPLGSCSNVNCHFEAVSPTWGRTPNYENPASCNQCHPMALDSGSHPKHATFYGSGTGSCTNCHPNHAVEAQPFRHATSAANRGIAVSFATGGSYSGNGLNYLPSQLKTTFGDCSATYCHSNGRGQAPLTTATWGGSLPADCTGCHGGSAANPVRAIATGNHGKHINNANFTSGVNLGINYSCARCHNGTVDVGSDLIITTQAKHLDGSKDVVFTDGGGYDQGACSATMCHSAGKATAPQPAAPLWGGGALDCKGCHGIGSSFGEPVYPNAGPGAELANSHSAKHFSNPSMCVNCHATTTSDGLSIINGSAAHTDGALTVRFPGAYDLGGASYDGTVGAKSCASTYCHSDGNNGPALEATKWGGKTTCRSCHGGDAASSAPVATYAHAAHMNNEAALGRGNNLMCAECHAKTMAFGNNTTLTNAANHLNVYKDYSGVRAGGKASYSGMVCSNVYCHSSGEKVPVFRIMTGSKKWDGNAKLGCDGCHGYGTDDFTAVAGEPNYKSRTGALNSHKTHTVGANMADSRGCAVCHRTTVDQGLKNKLKNYSSTHLNGVREVNFAVLANYTGRYDGATKSCSNTYCHGAGDSVAWGWQGTLGCSSCHKADGSLAGQHGSHWEGANPATSYTATPGNVTGTAAAYNFECSSCHSGAHAKGPGTNDNAAEVFFNYTSKGLKGSYSYGSTTAVDGTLKWSNGNCATTYCHSDGNGGEGFGTADMSWAADKTLGCNGCHGGAYGGANTNPIDTNLHKNHLDTVTNASLGTGNGLKCAACHAQTVGAGSDTVITDKRRHVNKFKDYSGALAGGSSSYDRSAKRCSNIYCHSNGKRGTAANQFLDPTPWGQPATLGCNGCHGSASPADFGSDAMGTPNYASGAEGSATSNSHKLHVQKMGISTSNACYVCHARTVDKYADKKFRPYSTTHLSDGTTHVTFGSFSTTGFKLMNPAVARYSGKTCSNVTCHSDGKGQYQDVKWGAASNCAMCHPLNKLSRGHSFHVYTSAVNNPTFYNNYTANRSTGGLTPRYNYGCGNCHPLNNPNHMKGTVLIDMTGGPGTANVVGTLRSKNAISVGGVIAGTSGSGTALSGGDVVCSNVYCHSNGYAGGAGLVYATTPKWNTGAFTGDRCAACHGNAPNSSIAGSPSHYNNNWLGTTGAEGGHMIGVHANVITNSVNFTGLLTPGTTDPSSHGQTPNVTPTTISCNTCHYSVITTSANSGSAQCISCHTGTAPTKALATIADKSLHVNGSVSVQFRPTKLFSKAQLSDTTFAVISSVYMDRINGYKAATSYDVSKIDLTAGSYAGSGGNCTTVCHFNRELRWDNVPAATCNSCHSAQK